MHSVKGKKGERERENRRETKAIGEKCETGNGDNQGRHETVRHGDRAGKNRRSGKFSTRKKSESRPALVSIAGCAVSLTFPLFVKRSAG